MFPFTWHFSLFAYHITWGAYTIFFLLAVVIGLAGSLWFSVKRGFKIKPIAITLGIMLVSAVIGARLLTALTNLPTFMQDPSRLVLMRAVDFSLYGGIVFAIASGILCARYFKLNAYKLGDTLTPFLGISIATMRVGCFLNGCCFGVETTLPWGVKFPLLSRAHLHQIAHGGSYFEISAVHPTQIYEMIAALLLSLLAFFMLTKKLRSGTTMLTFIALFSLFRLFNTFLRVDPDTYVASSFFYPIVYLLVAAICIFLAIKRNRVIK